MSALKAVLARAGKLFCALLVLSSCEASPPPRKPSDPGALRKECIALLDALERTFYAHWGSVESTREYARIRDEHLPILREIVESNQEQAPMALRVLAKRVPAESFSASVKAVIYWTAFQRDVYFNRWGVISGGRFCVGVYGNDLLGLGRAVAPYLQKSLRDTRRALVFGGEEERNNRIQEDRVCDYAWLFLARIYGRPVTYSEDSRLRDAEIRELDLWLDRQGR